MTDAVPRKRRRRPGPLPVIASSLAAFLAVLTLLGAQLRAGGDPALGAGTPVTATASGQHGATVVTRTSGAPAVAPAAQAPGASAQHHPLVTRSSPAGGEHDD